MAEDKKNNLNDQVAGESFDELTQEEMEQSQGAGDVGGEVTPLATVTTSSFPCSAGVSASATIVFSISKC